METVISRGLLLQLLRQALGSQAELVNCRIANQYHDYLVLLARLSHPAVAVVVKLAGPEAPLACPFERTAMLHSLVATRTDIPMPEVLAVDTSCQSFPWRYMIKAYMPGIEWAQAQQQMNAEELSAAYHQIGNAVAQLHRIGFPAFGELSVDGSVLAEGSYLAALRKRAQSSIGQPRLQELFSSALERRQHLFADIRRASLCHEDLHKYNILFRFQQGSWRLATILDFEKAWAGCCETDLARLDLWKGMTSHEFWQSYEEICPIDPLYEQRRPLFQLLWCLEYARSTPEHLADTRRLCAELGLPAPEKFE